MNEVDNLVGSFIELVQDIVLHRQSVSRDLLRCEHRAHIVVVLHFCSHVDTYLKGIILGTTVQSGKATEPQPWQPKQFRHGVTRMICVCEWGLVLSQLRDLRQLFVKRIESMAQAQQQPKVEESGVCLYACTVCNTVYSNVRESQGNSTFYRWGLREAASDYNTGTLHCVQGQVSVEGRCAQQPLHRVNLLGIRFGWDKKCYQLCARCSDCFVPDVDACTDWSGRGLLCSACTKAHRLALNTDPKHDFATTFVQTLDKRCAYCNESKNTDLHTHLYPYDLVLCYTHHSKAVRRRVEQAVAGKVGWRDYGTCDSKEATRAFLISLISRKKDDKHRRVVRQGVGAMKRNRQRNRQRKC
jgi:hypothetical protein